MQTGRAFLKLLDNNNFSLYPDTAKQVLIIWYNASSSIRKETETLDTDLRERSVLRCSVSMLYPQTHDCPRGKGSTRESWVQVEP